MTRTMRSIFALTCALCVAGLGAGPSAVARRVNRTATVVGAMKLCGPGQTPPNCGTVRKRGREIVAKSHGHRVAAQRLHDGRFKLHLVPGRYTLEVVPPRQNGPSKKIVARAHRTTVANFYFYTR